MQAHAHHKARHSKQPGKWHTHRIHQIAAVLSKMDMDSGHGDPEDPNDFRSCENLIEAYFMQARAAAGSASEASLLGLGMGMVMVPFGLQSAWQEMMQLWQVFPNPWASDCAPIHMAVRDLQMSLQHTPSIPGLHGMSDCHCAAEAMHMLLCAPSKVYSKSSSLVLQQLAPS